MIRARYFCQTISHGERREIRIKSSVPCSRSVVTEPTTMAGRSSTVLMRAPIVRTYSSSSPIPKLRRDPLRTMPRY